MANERSPSMFALTDNVAMRNGDVIILLARLSMGWLFLSPALSGFMNVAGTKGYLASLGTPAPDIMVWLALLGELAIAIGLIFGIATRYVALFTFAFLIVTILLGHRYWTYQGAQQANQYAHFLKNLALMGGALMIFWSGGGRYSLDARMGPSSSWFGRWRR